LNAIPAASAVESRRDSCEDQKKSKSLNKRTGRDSEDSREGESDDDLLSETATEAAKDLKNHMTGGADVMAIGRADSADDVTCRKVGVCDCGENFITIDGR